LRQQHPPFKKMVERCDFPNFIFAEMLHDASKFEVKLKATPPSFVKYNRTFPIRNEALNFIGEIVANKSHALQVFYGLGTTVKSLAVFARESEMVPRVDDPDYRRGAMRLLRLLNDLPPNFRIYEIICKSELLIALRDEELNDWENF
jgi:hypothetical protein